jgi:very-short-patch-repair endonuclease
VSPREFDTLVRSASLEMMMPGVHRIVGSVRTFEQVSLAPVLAAGGEARLARSAAARLLKLTERRPAGIDVMVRYESATRRGRIDPPTGWSIPVMRYVMRRTQRLEPVDRIVVDGIPTTAAARTLIDVAGCTDVDELESMFEAGRRVGLVTADQLARRIADLGGRGTPGSPKIRELVARQRGLAAADSELEVRLWRLLESRRFARNDAPTRQHAVVRADGRPARLDVAWPERRYGIEAEGWEWHEGRVRWKRDKRRTASLEAAGWRLTFVTWDDVTKHPNETLDRIAAAYAERDPRRHR